MSGGEIAAIGARNGISTHVLGRGSVLPHRTARLRKRNSSPDKRADAWRDSHQTFVQQDNLLPIDFAVDSPIDVNGLNGRPSPSAATT